MKLTAQQIEKIEHHLIDWGLEYQDFYDEVLNHFVSKIDSELSEDLSFESAFKAAQKDFTGKKFKERRGLKAFEAEYAHNIKLEIKKAIRGKMQQQFLTYRILVWGLIFLATYQFYNTKNELFLMPMGVLFIVFYITPLFIIPLKYQFEKQSKWFVTDHWPLEKSKRKLLYHKAKYRIMMMSIFPLFFVLSFVYQISRALFQSANGYESELPLWYQVIILIGSATALSVAWAQFELAIEEKRKRAL
ncbi:MAG: hypothetical protein ACI9IP_001736 [Arcticibacterium sp.]|jgi:hypothetical protein